MNPARQRRDGMNMDQGNVSPVRAFSFRASNGVSWTENVQLLSPDDILNGQIERL